MKREDFDFWPIRVDTVEGTAILLCFQCFLRLFLKLLLNEIKSR